MAEVKSLPIIETHYPVQRNYKPRKRWIMAMGDSKFKQKKVQNQCVETAYHNLVSLVKKQYLKTGEVYYERDHKTDTSDGLFGMYSFLTPSFYLWLECDLLCDYKVEFSFNLSLLEPTRTALNAYPLNNAASLRELQPDFETYYQTALRVQDKKFLFTHL